ncbi:MAG: hypothetical protein ACYDD1_11305 [Caulobacteraceae bacterium]
MSLVRIAWLGLAVIIIGAGLASCASVTENVQSPTPQEQRMPAHASEGAAAKVNLVCKWKAQTMCIPQGARTYLEVKAGDSTPAGKYAAAAFEAHLSGDGAYIVEDRALAAVIVKLRIAAAGIEDTGTTYGFPAMTLPPIPGKTTSSTTTPSLSFFSTFERLGVVELHAEAVDAKTGARITAVGPVSAVSRIRRGSVLTVFSFGGKDELQEVQTTTSR